MIRTLFSLPNLALSWLEPYSTAILSTLARFIFAAVLLVYYLNSGSLKLGEGLEGLWNPTLGAYAAILPKQMEAAGFDISQLSSLHHAIVILGTVSEIVLPVLVVIGLFLIFAGRHLPVSSSRHRCRSLRRLPGETVTGSPCWVARWWNACNCTTFSRHW